MRSLPARFLGGHRLAGLKLVCAVVLDDLVHNLGQVVLGYHFVQLLLRHRGHASSVSSVVLDQFGGSVLRLFLFDDRGQDSSVFGTKDTSLVHH